MAVAFASVSVWACSTVESTHELRLAGHSRPVVSLKAGFSRVDITPDLGILMPGYFKIREAKGTLDSLEANCLAFSDATTSALVAVIDCVDMPDAFADEAREAIAAKTGIDKEAILVHATHTHAGGDLRRTINRLLDPEAAAAKKRLSEAYARKTIAALADAAAQAVADLKPAHLSGGRSVARRISFGRRYRMKDGTVRTNPGVLNPDIVRAVGNPPDEEVQLLRIDREGADPIAVLNFQTHPDVIGGERFSADWPGFARRTFEASLEGRVRCLLVNGTEGDVNHVCVDPTPEEQKGLHSDFDDVPRGYAHAQHMGATIAAAALQVWHKTTTLEAGKISFGGKTVRVPSNRPRPEEMDEARRIDALHRAGKDAELPYKGMDLTTKVAAAERKIRLEHGPDHFDLPLCAIAIGDSVAFGGFPGEPFNDIGKAVKKDSPFKMTILACLANGDRGYFPFSDSYKEGGYESESSPFGPSVADDLIAGQLKLLNGLCGSDTNETASIQAEIDAVAANGGGRVTVAAGIHRVGGLLMRSNVELHLEEGAELNAVTGLENYHLVERPYSEGIWSAIVMGVGVTNVAITGKGVINGRGGTWPEPTEEDFKRGCQEGLRPRGIFFTEAKDIRLEDFTLRDSPCWGIVIKACDGLVAKRVKIDSHANWNNDGFDIEAKNVLVEDCEADTGDDPFCLKSNDPTSSARTSSSAAARRGDRPTPSRSGRRRTGSSGTSATRTSAATSAAASARISRTARRSRRFRSITSARSRRGIRRDACCADSPSSAWTAGRSRTSLSTEWRSSTASANRSSSARTSARSGDTV